jgi:hypothetical protein
MRNDPNYTILQSLKPLYQRREGHIYKEIPGYEGLYLACDQGYIVNLRSRSELLGYRSGAQLHVGLYDKDYRPKQLPVARLILTVFKPKSPDMRGNYQPDWIDGNRANNKLSNLEWRRKGVDPDVIQFVAGEAAKGESGYTIHKKHGIAKAVVYRAINEGVPMMSKTQRDQYKENARLHEQMAEAAKLNPLLGPYLSLHPTIGTVQQQQQAEQQQPAVADDPDDEAGLTEEELLARDEEMTRIAYEKYKAEKGSSNSNS